MKKIYLAIPYSNMEPSSYFQATRATALIMRTLTVQKLNVFSPIIHSHPLAQYNLPKEWKFWQEIDYQFIDWADEVWVLIPEEGYEAVQKSVGVQAEMKYAKENNKLIQLITYDKESKSIIHLDHDYRN